jgi:type II secretion system protein N
MTAGSARSEEPTVSEPRSRFRRRLLFLGYGVFAAVVFTVCIAASFPYADTISALVAPMGIRVAFQRQQMNFPLGARLTDVRVISVPAGQALLESPEIVVSPALFGLFFGQVRLRVRARMYGGVIDCTIHQSAGAVAIDFALDSLDLAQLTQGIAQLQVEPQAEGDERQNFSDHPGIAWEGELSGRGFLQMAGSDVRGGRASMTILGSRIETIIVNGLPSLDLGVVNGKIVLENGIATLQDISAEGSDGKLEAHGEIRLAPVIAGSEVNLTVSVIPTPKGWATFGALLNMLPHAPDEGSYDIRGLLSSPSVS